MVTLVRNESRYVGCYAALAREGEADPPSSNALRRTGAETKEDATSPRPSPPEAEREFPPSSDFGAEGEAEEEEDATSPRPNGFPSPPPV